MHRTFLKGLCCSFILCCSLQLVAQDRFIQLKNPLPFERKEELIELDRTFLEKKFGNLPEVEPLEIVGVKHPVAMQFDDMDGDGKWDKAVFLYSFKAGEKLKLRLAPTGNFIVSTASVAHVRQKRKLSNNSFGENLVIDSVPAGQANTDFSKSALPALLTEGPAWENDKVGFRIYMDVRNTKDIWGKRIPDLILDTLAQNPNANYHGLSAWGMDILAVGKSLGAGSLALSVPVPGKKDTLVRLGGLNMGKVIFRQIADGPVRAVFQMEYPQWDVLGNGKLTSVIEQVSIWGGQYFYNSTVLLKAAPAGAKLVTGIVNIKSSKSLVYNDNKTQVMSTFDLQSENKDHLGMAIMTDKSLLDYFGQTPNKGADILNTYTAVMKDLPADRKLSFRFYACWEQSNSVFKTAAGFNKFLIRETQRYSNPIVVY